MRQILSQRDFDADMDGKDDEFHTITGFRTAPIRKLFDDHRQRSEPSYADKHTGAFEDPPTEDNLTNESKTTNKKTKI